MKNNKIYLGAILGVVILLASCEKDSFVSDPTSFDKKKNVGFYQDSKTLYVFNQITDQLYYNKTNNTFRIMSDEGNNYVDVVLSGPIPEKGEKVTASIKNNGIGSLKDYSSVEFEVRKKTEDNCWLWSSSAGLGIVAYYVE